VRRGKTKAGSRDSISEQAEMRFKILERATCYSLPHDLKGRTSAWPAYKPSDYLHNALSNKMKAIGSVVVRALCYSRKVEGSRPDEANTFLFSIYQILPVSRLSRQCGILNISQPYRLPQPVTLWRRSVIPVRYELDCKYCYK
jgi:hypothetical protein